MKTKMNEPQPLSIIDKGGKIIAKITRNKDIFFYLYDGNSIKMLQKIKK